ncbi:DUF6550 family protein [Paenibacillus sp. 1P07SE]|uniref:DUF6550 family protein n=1 Tax=Paenibacillus sp. 1P07SE TaxID=3132209 RepID=UPI0039A572C6
MKRKIWVWTGCIILLGAMGLWALNNDGGGKSAKVETNQNVSPSPNPSAAVTIPDVTPDPSSDAQLSNSKPITVPDVPEVTQDAGSSISESPVLQPEKEVKEVEVPLTEPVPTPKPTEPPKPKPVETEQPQAPDTPPTYEEKETQPNKPQNEPNAGDKNSSGKVFVPGFGWVEDSGENQGSQSSSDGDWNKQVGTMD